MKLISTLVILFASFTSIYGYFLDKSCTGKYKKLVINGLENAFDLARAGSNALDITPSGSGAKWQAQKDLISYLLSETLTDGNINPTSQNWATAKAVFTGVLKYESYRPEEVIFYDFASLSTNKLILFCNLDRFKEGEDCNGNKRPGKVCDTTMSVVLDIQNGYRSCKGADEVIQVSIRTKSSDTV